MWYSTNYQVPRPPQRQFTVGPAERTQPQVPTLGPAASRAGTVQIRPGPPVGVRVVPPSSVPGMSSMPGMVGQQPFGGLPRMPSGMPPSYPPPYDMSEFPALGSGRSDMHRPPPGAAEQAMSLNADELFKRQRKACVISVFIANVIFSGSASPCFRSETA